MNQGERQVPHELCPQLTISRNRMAKAPHVRWFDSISLKDLTEVSGKNASIGELSALLAAAAAFLTASHSQPMLTSRRLMPRGTGQSCVASSPISTIVDLGQVRLAAAAGCFATVLM